MASPGGARRGRPETSGSLAGYFKRGRRYLPELLAYENLKANDWIRDDLPDLLWPLVEVVVHGEGGARILSDAQSLVLEVLSSELPDEEMPCFDGRLTSIEAVPAILREGVVSAFAASKVAERLVGPEIVGVLSLYEGTPGRWLLVDPWTNRLGAVSRDDAVDILREGIVMTIADRHANALVKSPTLAWLILRGRLSLHDPRSVRALKGYPLDEETRGEADAFILSSFLGFKSIDLAQDPELAVNQSRWASSFWNANWKLTRCLVVDRGGGAISASEHSTEVAMGLPDEEELHRLRSELETVLAEFLDSAFDPNRHVDLYQPARHEVVCGLVARAFRLVGAALTVPEQWSADYASWLMRTIAETEITIRWMAQQEHESGFERYVVYGQGRRVLMRRIIEQAASSLPPAAAMDAVGMVSTLAERSGGEWHEQFLEVSTETTFAGISLRAMAEETRTLDLYRHVFQNSSGVVHGEWWAIEDYDMDRCQEPLHRFHMIPAQGPKVDPTPAFGRHIVERFESLAELCTQVLDSVPPRSARQTQKMADDRDIDLVLITGAGASCTFGQLRQFPLMGGWSDALRKKIIDLSENIAFRKMIDLEGEIDGPEFERRLGSFLRQVQAFREIKPLVKASLELSTNRQEIRMRMPSQASALEEWYSTTSNAVEDLIEGLNVILYALFDEPGINDFAAAKGFGWLLEELRIDDHSRFVLATTNYDLVGETALARLGYRIDWGRPPQLQPSPDVELRVERLLVGVGSYVPVLHLHSRLGWYLKPDGTVRDMQGGSYSKQWGTPVVMWPDDEKDASSYVATGVIDMLWGQFQEALGRARKVLVLGHSLHDRFLVHALREHVPAERLAITICAESLEELSSPQLAPIRDAIQRNFGTIMMVPMVFGPEPTGVDQIRLWMQDIEQLD